MLTREELKGNWNEIQGRIKEKWGQLTDDELVQAKGNTDQLIGLIQRKTGEGREQITKFFDSYMKDAGHKTADLAGQAGEAVNQAAETAQQYVQSAQKYVQEGYQQAAQSVQEGVHQAEETVRSRPMESLGVAFGAGVITGVVVAVALRSR